MGTPRKSKGTSEHTVMFHFVVILLFISHDSEEEVQVEIGKGSCE